MASDIFWLGPLGALMPLGVPETGLSNALVKTSATSVSLNARTTDDVRGFRRVWTMDQAYLDPSELGFLEALYTGVVPGPLRLIDPLLKNRLRPSVAAALRTSVFNGSVDAWFVPTNNGIVSSVVGDYPKASVTVPGDTRTLTYSPGSALRWNPAANTNVLYPNGDPARQSRLDVVRPGEQVTQWFWARITGSGTATLGLKLANAALVLSTGPTVTFSNTTWQKVALTYTAPSDGSVVAIAPYFTVTTADTDIYIGAGQLEAGAAATTWAPGYGAPEVSFTNLAAVSPEFPLTTASLTITEL